MPGRSARRDTILSRPACFFVKDVVFFRLIGVHRRKSIPDINDKTGMSRTRSLLANLIVVAFGFSCSSPNEQDLPLHAPGFSTPVVTGLRITSTDPTVLAVW